jgi:DNA-binding transcriptional ArsR family regulator
MAQEPRKTRPVRAEPERADLFAALGDATRLALLKRLAMGKAMSIGALSENAVQTRQAVTKHLKALERAGFVKAKRVGRETRFAYQPRALEEAQDALAAIQRRWEDALDRLQALVES